MHAQVRTLLFTALPPRTHNGALISSLCLHRHGTDATDVACAHVANDRQGDDVSLRSAVDGTVIHGISRIPITDRAASQTELLARRAYAAHAAHTARRSKARAAAAAPECNTHIHRRLARNMAHAPIRTAARMRLSPAAAVRDGRMRGMCLHGMSVARMRAFGCLACTKAAGRGVSAWRAHRCHSVTTRRKVTPSWSASDVWRMNWRTTPPHGCEPACTQE